MGAAVNGEGATEAAPLRAAGATSPTDLHHTCVAKIEPYRRLSLGRLSDASLCSLWRLAPASPSSQSHLRRRHSAPQGQACRQREAQPPHQHYHRPAAAAAASTASGSAISSTRCRICTTPLSTRWPWTGQLPRAPQAAAGSSGKLWEGSASPVRPCGRSEARLPQWHLPAVHALLRRRVGAGHRHPLGATSLDGWA